WLGKAADWRESIRYLRRYANYLTPKVGLLSADTWNMWAIWSRNTILLQIPLVLSIIVVLLFPRVVGGVFLHWAGAGVPPAGGPRALVLGCIPFLLLTFSVVWMMGNLCYLKIKWKILPFSQSLTQWLIVVPLLGAALLLAAILWGQAHDPAFTGATYLLLLLENWKGWFWPGLVFFTLTLCLSLASIDKRTGVKCVLAGLMAVISVGAVYTALCGILWLFVGWCSCTTPGCVAPGFREDWYAFTFGPSLVLVAFVLTIIPVLGLLSRASIEGIREWSIRLGA